MRFTLSTLLPLAFICAAPVHGSALELDEVLVKTEESTELEAAKTALEEVPGASNVIDLNNVENGRTASNTDVLAYQPGIYAQSAGNDGAKVSVRGSGINRAPSAHGSGLYVMFDGLPLTGPGGTPYELEGDVQLDGQALEPHSLVLLEEARCRALGMIVFSHNKALLQKVCSSIWAPVPSSITATPPGTGLFSKRVI